VNNGRQVLVSDIDGTVIRWTFRPRIHEFLSRHKHWLIPFSPLFPFYVIRPCNREARKLIRYHREKGGRNIFFSATPDMGLTRLLVNLCLRSSRFSFDRLALCPKNESIIDFKLRIIKDEHCDILLENEADIVRYLVDKMSQEGVRSDVVKNGGYFIVRFSNN